MTNRIGLHHWLYLKGGIALSALAMLALGGCGTYTAPSSNAHASPPTVSYTDADTLSDAHRKAGQHCDRYGGVATVLSVKPAGNGKQSITFRCVAAGASKPGV
jgi:hypothetical protein